MTHDHDHDGAETAHTDADGHDHAHDHGDDHGHAHHTLNASARVLGVIVLLNFIGFVLEVAGGLIFGSIALLADGLHMLFDLFAYAIAFGAAYLAVNTTHETRWAYGMHRLEPTAALINGLLLIPLVGYVLFASFRRMMNPEPITVGWTLAIALVGLAINVVCVWILHGDEMSLNEKGAYYHLLGDVGGSVLVVVATLATGVVGLPIIDPIAAVIISIAILWSAWVVVRGGSTILLDQAPTNQADVKADIETVPGVAKVTDIHVWQVCSQLTVGTAHVSVEAESLEELTATKQRVRDCLNENGVDHVTVELHAETLRHDPPVMTHSHR